MLIIGVNTREKTVDYGQFHCPTCHFKRQYEFKTSGLYFSLFFIPIFRLNQQDSFIECQHCYSRFEPEIRNSAPPAPAVLAQVPAVLTDLEAGMPIQMVRQKLSNEGYQKEFIEDILSETVHPPTNRCIACDYDFVGSINLCTNCGRRISPNDRDRR